MAARFRDRILEGSGYSNKKFECDFGMKLLQKMGWKGEGLGKEQQGNTECVQIKRREEGLGLGVEEMQKKNFQWNDSWWENSYNRAIESIGVIRNDASEATSAQSSSDEEKIKKVKKAKKLAKAQKESKKTKKQSKQQTFDHLFSSCSSSSEEEVIYKKKSQIETTKKTKKISKEADQEVVTKKSKKNKDKTKKKYADGSEEDDE